MTDAESCQRSGGTTEAQNTGGHCGHGAGQAGLGSSPKPHDKVCGKEKCQLVRDEIEVEEERCSKMVGMHKQGA